MSKRSIAIAVIAVFVLTLVSMALAADNPFAGTWKLNAAKSTFDTPLPKSYILKIEFEGERMKWILDSVRNDGTTAHNEFTTEKESVEITTGNGGTGKVITFNASTHHSVVKKDGKVIMDLDAVLSKDGRTMTRKVFAINAQGQEIHRVEVFDKQ